MRCCCSLASQGEDDLCEGLCISYNLIYCTVVNPVLIHSYIPGGFLASILYKAALMGNGHKAAGAWPANSNSWHHVLDLMKF